MERLTQAREAEMKYLREQNEMEVKKSRDMATIETENFKSMVDAIGSNTLQAIATAGPEMQVCTETTGGAGAYYKIYSAPVVCVTA